MWTWGFQAVSGCDRGSATFNPPPCPHPMCPPPPLTPPAKVARLRRLRRLNLQAHSAYFEFERADLRALARMTGLVELKFGVMGGTEHAATNTAGVSHGSGSGAESIGSRQGGSGVLGVGAGASTGSSAEGGGSHRGGQVLGYDDVARELALMLPQCR